MIIILANSGACSYCGTSKSACDLGKKANLGSCCESCDH